MLRLTLNLISKLLNLLPRRMVNLWGRGMGSFWFSVVRVRRSVVVNNLRYAYGNSKSEYEIKDLARRNFQHYGIGLLELLQSFSWSAKDYQKYVELEGLENVEQALSFGNGAFFLACHLGNWEMMVFSGAARGIPVDIIVKVPRLKVFEEILTWYRNRLDVGVLYESGTAKDILRSLSRNRMVGFILDQFMGPPIGLPVKFFGQKAGTTVSLALLSEKKEVPILPVYSYRDERGKLHTVIEPRITYPTLSDDKEARLYQKTQIFNDIIEERVRRYPEQWLWLHRRWKEYRGTPRWTSKAAMTSLLSIFLFAFVLVAEPGNEPTGITIPPDPLIRIPEFAPESDSFEQLQKLQAQQEESPLKKDGANPAFNDPWKSSKRQKGRRKLNLLDPSETGEKGKSMTKNLEPDKSAKKLDIVPSYKIPFEVGEKMELDIGWAALPAGRAVLEVRKGEKFGDRSTFRLWGNALSSRLVDAIYHVDNTAESFIDSTGVIPYKFLLHMVESVQKKETRVSFDHTTGKAFYWAKRISKRWGDSTDDRIDAMVPQSKDMFSGLYYARTLSYALHKKETFKIYENGKNWDIELEPVANELVTTKAGAFQCWKLLVTVKLDNVLRPTGNIFMWLSDDSKKYLVKFDAKIKIGSLVGNLVAIRERQ